MSGGQPIRVFVSYSHQDSRWFDVESATTCLVPWLADSLRRLGVKFWWDRRGLGAGDEFRRRIETEIDRAEVALLLVSQAFLNSPFIETVELPRIRARTEQQGLLVVPILLEPCLWEGIEFIASRQMLPGRPTPLVDFTVSQRDWAHARDEILRGLKQQIDRMRQSRSTRPSAEEAQTPRAVEAPEPEAEAAPPEAAATAEAAPPPVTPGATAPLSILTAAPPPPPRVPQAARAPELACTATLVGHTDLVATVALLGDSRHLVSGGHDDTIRVWDLRTGECVRTFPNAGIARSVTKDGRRALAEGGAVGPFLLWDFERGGAPEVLDQTTSGYCTAISGDGSLAVRGGLWHLDVWDLATKACIRRLSGHGGYAVHTVALTPDGRLAVSGSTDNTARVWDVATGTCLQVLRGHENNVNSVVFLRDGRAALTGSIDCTLRLWDAEKGNCLKVLEGHTKGVNAVAATPDGHRAVSADADHKALLWDLEAGVCTRILTGHTDRVQAVDISPDGRRVVSGGWDKTIRVWDVPD